MYSEFPFLSDAQGVTLGNSDTIKIDLICNADETLNLGAIAGILSLNNADGTKSPLGGIKITLNDTVNTAIATTYTADDGEFAFYDIADGIYTLIATAEGYTADTAITATITNGSISNVDMTMTIDSRTYSGTVSGIIRVMLKYNGGGHKQVGTCQFSDENMETELPKMLKELCDLANN